VLQALEAAVLPDELHRFLLVWRPTACVVSGARSACEAEESVKGGVPADKFPDPLKGMFGGRSSSYTSQTGLPQPYHVDWQSYTMLCFVGLYKKMYNWDTVDTPIANAIRERVLTSIPVLEFAQA